MPNPGARELLSIEHSQQPLWIRVWNVPERIRADERVDVDHCLAAERAQRGKLFGGKIRAAFRQRIAFMSSSLRPRTSSARSFAQPVSIVRSQAQSNREAPR